jgi:energy-coupling factor transport system ATP-binding protein
MQINLDHITFRYEGVGGSPHPVLNDINLSFPGKEVVALLGPSGSGKTTLVQHLNGLLRPQSGTVRIDGNDIHQKGYPIDRVRRQIGIVFQFPETQLFEESVEKDVAFGPRNLGFQGDELNRRVREALNDVGMDCDLYGPRSPFQLSEGEKRRVAIAGVLAMTPDWVVFDEPTAGLDPRHVRNMIELVRDLTASGRSIVTITHNMDFVSAIAHRAVVLREGRLIFDGRPEQLFQNRDLLHHADLTVPEFYRAFDPLRPHLPSVVQAAVNLDDLSHRLYQLNSDSKSSGR